MNVVSLEQESVIRQTPVFLSGMVKKKCVNF